MARKVSILLLLLFGISLMAPAWSASGEAKLPPCCHRDGKHGCGMKAKSASTLAWRTGVCSAYGQVTAVPASAKALAAGPVAAVAAGLVGLATAVRQTEARVRISFHRSRQKRGPPTLLT